MITIINDNDYQSQLIVADDLKFPLRNFAI